MNGGGNCIGLKVVVVGGSGTGEGTGWGSGWGGEGWSW